MVWTQIVEVWQKKQPLMESVSKCHLSIFSSVTEIEYKPCWNLNSGPSVGLELSSFKLKQSFKYHIWPHLKQYYKAVSRVHKPLKKKYHMILYLQMLTVSWYVNVYSVVMPGCNVIFQIQSWQQDSTSRNGWMVSF